MAATQGKSGTEEVRRLVEATGRTQQQVARDLSNRLGRKIGNEMVSRMVTGQRGVKADEMDALRELAKAPGSAAGNIAEPTQMFEQDIVPLYGQASAAGEALRLGAENQVGVAPIHPAQKGTRSPFAFFHYGDLVAPRLNHGDTGYAVRSRPPLKGQLCVIELADGNAFVRFYDGQDAATVFGTVLAKNSKDVKESFPLRDVAAIHAVVGATFGSA